MPQIKSAFKRLKQDKKKHVANKAKLSMLRTMSKKVRTAIAEKNTDEAGRLIKQYESKLDKAAKTNLIKKENASRKISRLRKAVSKIK